MADLGDQNYMELYGITAQERKSTQNIEPDQATTSSRRKESRRKASNSNKNEDPKLNGKRGRPRVDQQDQNAVERRRTQIRLAQRAYRERKETTIQELERRVSDLKGTISAMTQAYLDFNDKATACGLASWNHALGQNLDGTTERILDLSSQAQIGLGSANEEVVPAKRKKISHASSTVHHGSSVPDVKDPLDNNGAQTNMSPSSSDISSDVIPADMLGYQITYESSALSDRQQQQEDIDSGNKLGHLSQTEIAVRTPVWPGAQEVLQYRADDMSDAPVYNAESSWVDTPMKPIFTYNFQESSFTRRLLRYSYEKTYHMLINPNTPPEKIQKVLRYSMCFGDLKSITERIRNKLLKTKHESLEQWDMPMLHIGGAGLHFPRENADDTSRPVQGYLRERNIGPWSNNGAGIQAPIADFPYDLERFADVEGVWFDSSDVEQYLRTKGLFLDGHSSTAVMEIDDTTLTTPSDVPLGSPNSSIETFSGPESPETVTEQMNSFFTSTIDNNSFANSSTIEQALSGMEYDFSLQTAPDISKDAFTTATDAGYMFNEQPLFNTLPSKRKVVVDVDKLLEAIDENAACLGRAPGFRQMDVDAALNRVLQEAWGDV